MENSEEKYSTASHDEDLDEMFQDSLDFNEEISGTRDIKRELRTIFRYYRRKIKNMYREKMQKNFYNILYLTIECPVYTPNSTRQDSPLDYINQMQKQYPEYDIRLLVPIINIAPEINAGKKLSIEVNGNEYILERTSIHFNFLLQNKNREAVIYKYPKTVDNIQVYGIYCEAFSYVKDIVELSKIQYLAPLMKAVRIAVRRFSKTDFVPDIVHCEHIPYYLGGEFELPIPQSTKVLQIVKDFNQFEIAKPEVFWAAVNLADEAAMKKICCDDIIKKCMMKLFNLKETRLFARMRNCLDFLYDNYSNFRKYVEQGEVLDENAIFKRLNKRVSQLFPQLADGELYYNQISYTIKRVDYWAVASKTYYCDIFETPKITGKIYAQLKKTKRKSAYVSYGCDLSNYMRESGRMIYYTFGQNNFRVFRPKNKAALLKELSSDRIKTNFVDPTLFKDDMPLLAGNLDTFYDAPLLFANPTAEVFSNGIDILFNSILKLFELHKNIQIIICIKDGFKNNFIKSWVKFLSDNKSLNGKWVFIDSAINLPKFLAASDMILLPRRTNMTTPEHFVAMKYGCVPVAARCGILDEDIQDIFDDITYGCGFKTKKSLLTEDDNPEIFLTPLLKAIQLYQNNPSSWNLLIKNCLNHDSSWDFKTLEKYDKIYQELI